MNAQYYPKYRNFGRGPSPEPHEARIYNQGKLIGTVRFPASDPRFVKDRELFDIAFDQIKSRELLAVGSEAQSGHFAPGSWDRFEISFCGVKMVGNNRGERLKRNSLDWDLDSYNTAA